MLQTNTQKYILIAAVVGGLTLSAWFYTDRLATAEAERGNGVTTAPESLTNTPAHPFMDAFSNHTNAILIDIRTPEEFASGHIPGAINVDYYDPLFTQEMRQVAGDKAIFMYCRSGNRSSDAKRRLTAQGLMVEEMRGGILSYRGPLESD